MMRTSEDILLFCEDISKTYPGGNMQTEVLKQVNLQFKKGSINLIYGKSGSGKSTLLNILAGLDQASYGDVYYQGRSYSSMSDSQAAKVRGENFGFIFQAYHLIPRISVESNILCPVYINGKKYDEEYYRFLIEILGIEKLIKKKPFELSGGEQQRVSIARALAKNPKLLLCDEPTGALDYNTGKQILKLLQDMCREKGMTVIVITHNLAIAPMADRVIHIKNGKVSSMEVNENPVSVETIEW